MMGSSMDSSGGMREYIEFHNPDATERVADLIFDLRGLPAEIPVSLQLSTLETVAPLPESLTGIADTRPTPAGEAGTSAPPGASHSTSGPSAWLWARLSRVLPWLFRGSPVLVTPRATFAPTIYDAQPAALVVVRGVRLASQTFCAARLMIPPSVLLPAGSAYAITVQQQIKGIAVGGSTYVLRAAGVPPTTTTASGWMAPERWEETGDENEDELEAVPPWARSMIAERRKALGKTR
jgi:hypothetical protein